MAKDFGTNTSAWEQDLTNSNSPIYASGDVFACSIWYQHKTDPGAGVEDMVSMSSAAGGNGNFWIRLRQNGLKISFVYTSSSGIFHAWETTNTFAVGTSWRHLAMSYTYGTGSSILCYVDGVNESGAWWVRDGDTTTNNGAWPTRWSVPPQAGSKAQNIVLADAIIYQNPGVDASYLAKIRRAPWTYTHGSLLSHRFGLEISSNPDPSFLGPNTWAVSDGVVSRTVVPHAQLRHLGH